MVFDRRAQFPEFSIPPQSYRYANGNAWAAYLIPLIFLQLGLFFSDKRLLTRWLTALSIVWTMVLVFFCSSRGGMIGLGAAGVTFVIVEYKTIWEWLQPAWNSLLRRRWLAAGLGLAVFSGVVATAWLMFRVIELTPSHGTFGFDARAPFWIPAWKAFLQSPLWGNGIFTQAGFYMTTTSIPPNGLYFHSHNMFLDILAGTGLIGMAAAFWFIYELFKGLIRARRNAPANSLPIVIAAIPVLTGFLFHSLFDSLYWLPMVSIPLLIIFGTALRYDDRMQNSSFPRTNCRGDHPIRNLGVVLCTTTALKPLNQRLVETGLSGCQTG